MKKILKKYSIFILSVTILGVINVPVVYAHAQIDKTNVSHVTPFADITEWKYKLEDGMVYKRLYNHSKQKWIGDWILVG